MVAYDQSTERPPMSCCEKMHKAVFGRLNRNSKKIDVPSPSPLSTTKTYVSATPIRSEGKDYKKFIHFLYVDNNGDASFSEDKYNSYIDGMKMKMRAPSDVGHETAVPRSRSDSFNEKVSSFISHAKQKLVATPSMVSGAKTPEL